MLSRIKGSKNEIAAGARVTGLRKKPLIIRIALVIAVFLVTMAAVSNDYSLYSRDIGKITDVSEKYAFSKTNRISEREYTEKYYTQTITAVLKNGSRKGEKVTLTNTYASSQVYDTKYTKGSSIFIDNIKSDGKGGLKGSPSGVKRDWLIASMLALLTGLFLLTGGREGALTILSLTLNMIAFYFVLLEYTKGHNILLMTIPMTVFFSWMLLFFMYGRGEKTYLAFVSTLISIALTSLIAFAAMRFGGRIDYDFMSYLDQPYEQSDADLIFLSELIVGCLGSVMDVVVTMVATVSEIARTGSSLSTKSMTGSCRAVGDDLVGTMISLMFFTNTAANIPSFILYMRNGISIPTILHYNVFFELARFLSGSIGVVLSIFVASAVSVMYYRRKKVVKC
ncbi:MAG: YibE/F family protein [Anaerovoracaceae bacterium]